jgi:RHS repeat-associated protein
MIFKSLARCVIAGGGGILLLALLSCGQPVRGQKLLDGGASLVDVTAGVLYDGWGRESVRTLSAYYSAGSGAVEMLSFRPSFLPAFDWANGRIELAVTSDLYSFYADGAGARRVQNAADPSYVFSYRTRYPEPAGRLNVQAGEGYALGFGASQSRLLTSDDQNWDDASLGTASGIADAGLGTEFNTSSRYGGFGADLTVFAQKVRDRSGLTGLSRQAWQTAGTAEALWSAKMVSFDQSLPASFTPPDGMSGPMSRIRQRLLGNYFAGDIEGQSGFSRLEAEVDRLGQWALGYDPNRAGAAHVFRDDAGRVRFFRNNADLGSRTSQGFRYIKYDQWNRVTEMGVLVNVVKSSFQDYADWARQADLDQQLASANSCPVFTFRYDADPVTGSLTAYDERRGAIAKRSYYPTAIDDQPTDCPGRAAGDPVNESLYQYDDLRRTELLSEHRQTESDDIYRTTVRQWPNGGLVAQVTFPDKDQTQAFDSNGQGSISSWSDVMGRAIRLCSGRDCSSTVYSDITQFDWISSPLLTVAGNGVSTAATYDLRGQALATSATLGDYVLFAETLRTMQIADDENPCPGSPSSPDYAAGLVIARALSGEGLPTQDQGVWDCYGYDGAQRLIESSRYQPDGESWVQTSSFTYGLDGNSNVRSIIQSGDETVSFTRSGSDLLSAATLASGENLAFAYDATYGDMTRIEGSGTPAYSLLLTSDPVLQLPLSQTIRAASGTTLLTAAITYDAQGLRASRMVDAPHGEGRSTTSDWYGGALHPLVVTRDGVNYRLIGKSVIEALAGNRVTRSYAYADHLGSVRMVTDDAGNVVRSLTYDGDYGLTRIAGQSYAASDDSMESFYRFQGQEQEIFPLAKLGIDDDGLGQWLDRLQLYHFPWRDYAAGLAAFMQTDPIPTEDSLYSAFAADPANVTDETGGIAVLANTDTRTESLLYEIRSNGGINLSREDRLHLWNLLQDVRAETPESIDRELSGALPLWRNRYQNAMQEWLEAIELEITQDVLVASPNHQFTPQERDDIRSQADAIARYGLPDRAVASALDELSSYQLLDDPEKRASYECYRCAWISTHGQLIEDLYSKTNDAVGPDLLQSTNTGPGPQVPSTDAAALAAREEHPFERSDAEKEEEKADHEVKGGDDEKGYEPHGQR